MGGKERVKEEVSRFEGALLDQPNVSGWHNICFKKNLSGPISKMKIQPSDREKIIANEAADEGLISKIYKQLLQLNSRKINKPIK